MTGLRMWLRGMLRGNEVPETNPRLPDVEVPEFTARLPNGNEVPETNPRLKHEQSQPYRPRVFADDTNDFACAMYGQLRQRPGNIFYSPFSIRSAVAMTYAGARGKTAAQMKEALQISSSDETLHIDLGEIIQRLNWAGGGEYEIVVANSLWGQQGEPFQPGFVDLIARHYGDCLNLINFRDDAEASRAIMNQWVEDNTRQKIRDLIPSGAVDVDTRMALLNAVYFKGTWVLPFRKARTRAESFYLEGGGKVQAALMHQHCYIRYLQSSGYQAVELMYEGGDLSMLVLLPDRKDGLRDLEAALSARMLRECVSQMDACDVKLFLPRFKSSLGAVDLRDQLTSLGMPLAFDRLNADFSGMNGYGPRDEKALSLSAAFHEAFVEVDEKGTEATSLSAMLMQAGSAQYSNPPPVPIFRADHPFLFAIRDRKSDAIIFLGRIADPTRQS